MTCWGTRDRWGYPPEPFIKNYELWLDWLAHQLDTPHWWEKLTAILEVGDPRKLVQKIHASSDIPAVQCKALQIQDYTISPALKCLMRDMFLPDDPSYQDSYTQVLQYWAEEASLPAPGDTHPLVMSVVELRQHVGRYTTFSKQDILKDLGSAIPTAKDEDTGNPQAHSTASPTMTDVRDTWLSPTKLSG